MRVNQQFGCSERCELGVRQSAIRGVRVESSRVNLLNFSSNQLGSSSSRFPNIIAGKGLRSLQDILYSSIRTCLSDDQLDWALFRPSNLQRRLQQFKQSECNRTALQSRANQQSKRQSLSLLLRKKPTLQQAHTGTRHPQRQT